MSNMMPPMPAMMQPIQTSVHTRGSGNGQTINVPDNTEALLAQRMSERTNMDKLLMSTPQPQGLPAMLQSQSPSMPAMPQPGFQSPQQGFQMPQQGFQMPQQQPQPQSPSQDLAHPEVIKKFMTFTEKEKRKFAVAQPMLYAKIVTTLNMQQSIQLPAPAQVPVPVPVPVSTPTFLASPAPPAPIFIAPPPAPPAPTPTFVAPPAPIPTFVAPPPPPEKTVMVSIDFRTDIRDVNHNKYVISLPEKQTVTGVKLESCIIPQLAQLEGEPYIYIAVSELEGDYSISNSNVPVFGKLVQEKTVNNFIIYRPENCIKRFKTPKLLDTLKVGFLNYDKQTIQLNRLSVSRISGTKKGTLFKITCQCPHYLCVNDKVTINTKISNKLVSELSTVRHIVSPDTFVIDRPFGLANNTQPAVLDTTIEKTNLKCTLTFSLTVSAASAVAAEP